MTRRSEALRTARPRLRPEDNRGVTLIVFSREPRAGYCKTRLIPRLGAEGAAELARAFLVDAISKCRALNPARLIIAAQAQDGVANSRGLRLIARRFGADLIDQGEGTLGERMARALNPYRHEGAVLIGTDIPSLPLRLLAQSVAMLRRAPVVIAPSLDGGYYLLGAKGKMPDIFNDIEWGRAYVFRQTLERLHRAGTRYALGPAWYDVDRFSDVLLLTAHLMQIKVHRNLSNHRNGSADAPADPAMTGPACPATARALARLGLLHAGR